MSGVRKRTTGISKPPTLKPISESSVLSSFSQKFANMNLDGSPPPADVDEWEVRPGGMLVQKRDPNDASATRPPPSPICVRVKYGSAYHEIRISPQASFGELKKLLCGETGLHPEGQKLMFKDKERDSTAFLDMSGVKDRSKVVLVEDPTGQAKRFLELRKNAKMEMANKTLHQISRDVDKLVIQVKALDSLVGKGKRVAEGDVVGLTEQLMNQLLRLDAVAADGEAKMQRRAQVKRVQRYVEILDVLKVKNNQISSSQSQQKHEQSPSQLQVAATTKWEPFDLLSSGPSASAATAATVNPTTVAPPVAHTPPMHVKFNWELFG